MSNHTIPEFLPRHAVLTHRRLLFFCSAARFGVRAPRRVAVGGEFRHMNSCEILPMER
jgi:hypothetical protein